MYLICAFLQVEKIRGGDKGASCLYVYYLIYLFICVLPGNRSLPNPTPSPPPSPPPAPWCRWTALCIPSMLSTVTSSAHRLGIGVHGCQHIGQSRLQSAIYLFIYLFLNCTTTCFLNCNLLVFYTGGSQSCSFFCPVQLFWSKYLKQKHSNCMQKIQFHSFAHKAWTHCISYNHCYCSSLYWIVIPREFCKSWC